MTKKIVGSSWMGSLTLCLLALGAPSALWGAGPTTDLEPEVMEPQDTLPVESPVFEMLQNEPEPPAKPGQAAPLIEEESQAIAPAPPAPIVEVEAPAYDRWASDPLGAPGNRSDDNALSRDVRPQAQESSEALSEESTPLEETKPTPALAAPAPTTKSEKNAKRDEILENPTRSIETYEKVRRDYVWEKSEPDWGFNLGIAPRAYRNADLRVPINGAPNEGKPRLTGILAGGERVLLHNAGHLSLGGEFGMFGNTPRNQFSGLLTAVLTLGPYISYRGQFFTRQLIVPTIKVGYEAVRVNYAYAGNKVKDLRTAPRIDLGFLVYLNFLEPSSAGLMQSNYGIKRTYLMALYSMAPDSSKKDVNLTESGAIRAGFRFEF